MNVYLTLAPLVAILGLLIYALASNPKASELGRIMFAFGLLVTLLVFSGDGAHFALK